MPLARLLFALSLHARYHRLEELLVPEDRMLGDVHAPVTFEVDELLGAKEVRALKAGLVVPIIKRDAVRPGGRPQLLQALERGALRRYFAPRHSVHLIRPGEDARHAHFLQ